MDELFKEMIEDFSFLEEENFLIKWYMLII